MRRARRLAIARVKSKASSLYIPGSVAVHAAARTVRSAEVADPAAAVAEDLEEVAPIAAVAAEVAAVGVAAADVAVAAAAVLVVADLAELVARSRAVVEEGLDSTVLFALVVDTLCWSKGEARQDAIVRMCFRKGSVTLL